jgi:hypothetical protein
MIQWVENGMDPVETSLHTGVHEMRFPHTSGAREPEVRHAFFFGCLASQEVFSKVFVSSRMSSKIS